MLFKKRLTRTQWVAMATLAFGCAVKNFDVDVKHSLKGHVNEVGDPLEASFSPDNHYIFSGVRLLLVLLLLSIRFFIVKSVTSNLPQQPQQILVSVFVFVVVGRESFQRRAILDPRFGSLEPNLHIAVWYFL